MVENITKLVSDMWDRGLPFQEITVPRELPLLENGQTIVYYGLSHAFIGCIENARVFGPGFIIADNRLLFHGLSGGNYTLSISQQLKKYRGPDSALDIPDGGDLDAELVLLWGTENFGHWLFTYLMRLTLLWHKPELKTLPLLISDQVPKRFLDWLSLMGFRYRVIGRDGVRVRKLWVPSIVTYRGHDHFRAPFVRPEAVHLMRHILLKDMVLPRYPRERLYLSRNKAKWRRMDNEDALVKLLSAHGIRRVFMEELPVESQLDLISRADLIVTHAGACSPLTMFAPMNAHIIEITLERFVGTFASACWAHILGQRYTRIDAKPTTKAGTLGIDYDCEVDPSLVETALKGN